jgi:outer membrane protein assembly factor BamB
VAKGDSMRSTNRVATFFPTAVLASLCLGAQTITLSPPIGPPTAVVTVNGAGFPQNTILGVVFDKKFETSVLTDASGAFQTAISVPAKAGPGMHHVVAESGTAILASANFRVRTDWPQFGFIPAGGRWNTLENTLSVSSAPRLVKRWTFTTGDRIDSSPVVANGVVYVSSGDNNLYALNARTGAKLWSFATGGITSSPAVANGVVYVGSYDSNVYALDASTGTLLWTSSTWSLVETVAVANGVVYAGSGYNLFALNASNGGLVWIFRGGDWVLVPPTIANGMVYVGAGDGLHALDAGTGAELWKFDTGDSLYSSPTVANGAVYLASRTNWVYALNASTGALLWQFNTIYRIESSIAFANGVVYLGAEHGVWALNASTGETLWQFVTSSYMFTDCSPAVANGVVYVGSYDYRIYALNASTGALLWRYRTGNSIGFSSPAVANGMVYVGSYDHKVYAFGLPLKGALPTDAGSDLATEE